MNELLKDVMLDACKRMKDEEGFSELLFFTIIKMLEYTEILRNDGPQALEAVKNEDLRRQLNRVYGGTNVYSVPFAIPLGVQLIADGEPIETVAEMLIAQYWLQKLADISAMANYIAIRAWVAVFEEERDNYAMQKLLTAFIHDGNEKGYNSYKLKNFPQLIIKDKTPKKELMKRKHDFGEKSGYIITVRDKLEKRIMDAPVDILGQMIESDSMVWQLSVVIKYTSDAVREKIFSCMTDEIAEKHSDRAAYMGEIRHKDIMDALTCVLLQIMECDRRTV